MTDTGLDLRFAGAESSPDLRVTLESPPETANALSPTLADIRAMLARARSGLSARTYQMDACAAASVDAEGGIRATLAALAWPSRADLTYRLDLPEEAEPGEVAEHRVRRRAQVWVAGERVVTLPWRMEDVVFAWHPRLPLRDSRGAPADAPAVRIDQARVILSAPVYGLLVVSGTACGYRHPFSLAFGKFDAQGRPQRIDLDGVPVTASWTGAAGEEESVEADIAVPACVATLLAACEDGTGVFRGVSRSGAGYVEVAYSSCDGHVLGTRVVREGRG